MKSSPTDVSTVRLMPAADVEEMPARDLPLAIVIDRSARENLLDDGLLVAARAGGLFPYFCALDEALRGTHAGAVLVAGERACDVLPSLVQLRRAGERALVPLIAVVRADDPAEGFLAPRWRALADVVLDGSAGRREWSRALVEARAIAGRLSRMAALEGDATTRRRLSILRFALARELAALAPERDVAAPLGYRVAPFDVLAGDALDADLAALTDAGLLSATVVDRVHACSACGDARLLFREVCSACGSADLSRGEVIHHYACGSVAEAERFRRGQRLECPWCGEELRDIGVDHERPAALTHCAACATAAGEGVTGARCLACGLDQPGHATVEKSILRHELTDAGRFAARSGRMA
jgi:hypothetical protein